VLWLGLRDGLLGGVGGQRKDGLRDTEEAGWREVITADPR
jgi:hypothetical protein